MTDRIHRFLEELKPPTPCLVIDLDVVAEAYTRLAQSLPLARIFYAVKANPAAAILDRLTGLGSCFDTASRGEIEMVLAAGAASDRISFGNTIKKEADIAFAYERGVRLFAFDSQAELGKIARAAPGASVFCRILIETEGAQWPLSRKFGCTPEMAVELLEAAGKAGLDPYGISFHVGSQQTDPEQWDGAIGRTAAMFRALAERNIALRMINLGGGLPARYRDGIAPVDAYGAAMMASVIRHFGNDIPDIIIEPGRGMVGEAGILQSEVVLIADKGGKDRRRWVYLDVGRFNGLAETMGEAIQYEIRTPHDGNPAERVILAGPTCDSVDVIYEESDYRLPVDLAIGDKVEFLATGAYTSTYASVCFNGFEPLKTYCV